MRRFRCSLVFPLSAFIFAAAAAAGMARLLQVLLHGLVVVGEMGLVLLLTHVGIIVCSSAGAHGEGGSGWHGAAAAAAASQHQFMS